MSPPKRNTGIRGVRVGIFIVIAIVLLILLILNASGDISPFASKITLRARFANADGLRPGAEVQLAGLRVGSVEEVRLLPPSEGNQNERVEVVLAVDETIDGQPVTERIRTDSIALLTSPSLLAPDKVVNISPGSAVADPVTENYLLRSSSGGGLSDLTSSGKDLTEQLTRFSTETTEIARKINQGQGTFGRLINDEAFYNNLNAAVRESQDLINQIRAGRGTAGRLINDPALYESLNASIQQLQTIATDLQQGRGTAGKLLTDEQLYNETRDTIAEARQSITRLNESIAEINLVVSDLRAGRGTAGKLLTDEQLYNDTRAAIARFNTTAERIDSLVAGAQRGEGTLGKLLTDEQLYNNVNQLSAESVKLLYDFRQNPRKYLTVKFELF
ncbi:MAG: MlaD family protein [Pyrinomonadaceae bacterium MAG19_C2-C3]|nr:MlaD family protein [Pyrinomonadaceae bacterium MAG19_C2-C3]